MFVCQHTVSGNYWRSLVWHLYVCRFITDRVSRDRPRTPGEEVGQALVLVKPNVSRQSSSSLSMVPALKVPAAAAVLACCSMWQNKLGDVRPILLACASQGAVLPQYSSLGAMRLTTDSHIA